MKLFLHIGSVKTGSSFMQSFLANNREFLLKHKVHFPKAGIYEKNMIKGKISPGNAGDLNSYLASEKWSKAEKWLSDLKSEVELKQCESLLLTNELLLFTFSVGDTLKKFMEIVHKVGFQFEKMLLIIRDPTSQAMSFYQHRSKNGNMKTIETWLIQEYTLAETLKKFYNKIDNENIEIAQFAYEKRSQYLVDVMLNHWLGFNEKVAVVDARSVNKSLTLSELKLLSFVYEQDAFLAKKFYEKMLNTPQGFKSEDRYIKQMYYQKIDLFLSKEKELWQDCNNRMKIGEIQIPEANEYKAFETEALSFSERQLESISEVMALPLKISFRLSRLIYFVKKGIKRIFPKDLNKQIAKLRANV